MTGAVYEPVESPTQRSSGPGEPLGCETPQDDGAIDLTDSETSEPDVSLPSPPRRERKDADLRLKVSTLLYYISHGCAERLHRG